MSQTSDVLPLGMTAANVAPGRGFADPVHGAQQTFRALLDAMARPMRSVPLPAMPDAPAGFRPELAAVALALLDADTPYALTPSLATPAVTGFLAFHTGAPQTTADRAAFVFAESPDALPPLDLLPAGTAEYPDRSATVVVPLADLAAGDAVNVRLSGPGFADPLHITPAPGPAAFWRSAAANHERYPLGIDFILTGQAALSALPRSTRIEVL